MKSSSESVSAEASGSLRRQNDRLFSAILLQRPSADFSDSFSETESGDDRSVCKSEQFGFVGDDRFFG